MEAACAIWQKVCVWADGSEKCPRKDVKRNGGSETHGLGSHDTYMRSGSRFMVASAVLSGRSQRIRSQEPREPRDVIIRGGAGSNGAVEQSQREVPHASEAARQPVRLPQQRKQVLH